MLLCEVLTTPVGVKHDAGGAPTAGACGHVQRINDELGAHGGGHGVAQQAPRPEVQDDREMHPALGGGDEGDVAGPDDIGTAGREVAAHQIRRRPGGAAAPST